MFAKCGLVCIVCTLPLIAGCNTGPSTSPLQSEITVVPSTVAPGGPFTATIVLTNEDDRTLTFVGSSSCRATFEILSGETVVGIGPNACTDDLSRYDLEPGEELTVEHTATAVGLDLDPLDEGTYRIRVVARVAEPIALDAEGTTALLVVNSPDETP